MSSLTGNPRGEGQCCSTHRLKLVWEGVGLRSLDTGVKAEQAKVPLLGQHQVLSIKETCHPPAFPRHFVQLWVWEIYRFLQLHPMGEWKV